MKLNIFQIAAYHDGSPGFWVWKAGWGNTCAKITHVGPLSSKPPYYGNPKIISDVYDCHTGQIKDAGFEISAPGGARWHWIQPPPWSGEARVAVSSARLDAVFPPEPSPKRQAEQSGARVWFRTTYEQREKIKSLKAKWSPEDKLWWMPAKATEAIAAARAAGFEVVDRAVIEAERERAAAEWEKKNAERIAERREIEAQAEARQIEWIRMNMAPDGLGIKFGVGELEMVLEPLDPAE